MINLRLDMFYNLREDGQEVIEIMDVLIPAYPTARFAIWQSREIYGVSICLYLESMPQTTRSACVVDYNENHYNYDYEVEAPESPRPFQAIWDVTL